MAFSGEFRVSKKTFPKEVSILRDDLIWLCCMLYTIIMFAGVNKEVLGCMANERAFQLNPLLVKILEDPTYRMIK